MEEEEKTKIGRWLSKKWWAGVAVIVAIILFVLGQCLNKPTSHSSSTGETTKVDSIAINTINTNSKTNSTNTPKPPNEVTITETGSASHYYEDEAIKLAKSNALNNLKSNYGLTDAQIRNHEFSILKIDSLKDNIRATVKVSVNIKEKENE